MSVESTGSLPESSTRGLLVGKLLVGGLGVILYVWRTMPGRPPLLIMMIIMMIIMIIIIMIIITIIMIIVIMIVIKKITNHISLL